MTWQLQAAKPLRSGGPSLLQLIRQAPHFDQLDISRAHDKGRTVKLEVQLLDPWEHERPTS